ncbi:MAG TPA: hypothetical protein VN612_02945 [Acidobacteriaceae bacterium]|jgi:hypothetical protein|nr:hypothetical protein [Acidobacteriaceae bacterium]
MLIHLTLSDIDAADRVTNPVALAIARTMDVERVILFKGDPPTEHEKDIRGFWLRWQGAEIYLPYRAQIICSLWEYGPNVREMRVVTKDGPRMASWDEIVRPCKFEIEELEEKTK